MAAMTMVVTTAGVMTGAAMTEAGAGGGAA